MVLYQKLKCMKMILKVRIGGEAEKNVVRISWNEELEKKELETESNERGEEEG